MLQILDSDNNPATCLIRGVGCVLDRVESVTDGLE